MQKWKQTEMVAGETLLVVVTYKDLSLFFNTTLLFVFVTRKTLSSADCYFKRCRKPKTDIN